MLCKLQVCAQRKAKIKSITNHPYFGFFLITLLMLLVQFLQLIGISIPVAVMRAFGLTMIYIIVALGFSILLGYAGLASLGTAGFVGVGTYLLGYLTNHNGFSIFLIIIITILGAVLIGTIVGFISLRIEGMYLAIITLGLSEILNEIFKNASAITNGTNGLGINSIVVFSNYISINNNTIFIIMAFVMFLMMVFTLNIIKSPTGRAMLAMRNSESAAQAMGVSVFKYRLLAFIISTVYALLGGVIYMSYISFTIPSTWTLGFSLNILAAVIVGGSQSIYGIVLGTFMIFGLNLSVLQQIPFFIENPAVSIVFNGILIVVVIMFYPGGLVRLVMSLKVKLTQLFNKWKKQRREFKYGKDME
ncbi:MAG: branched-chain amino acid ABC transporter permease [Candidatus Izemoplasmatales bacterium]|nr:branched-chain amino acid ABC transporter permease [Candidatus Izemoplasmatales bacterium]